MTPDQRKCRDVIRAYLDAHGIAPSYPEIAAAMGIRSRGRAHDLVTALVAQGELIRTAAKARNLRFPEVDLSAVTTEALRAELMKREA